MTMFKDRSFKEIIEEAERQAKWWLDHPEVGRRIFGKLWSREEIVKGE